MHCTLEVCSLLWISGQTFERRQNWRPLPLLSWVPPSLLLHTPARNVQKSLLTAFWGFFSHSYKPFPVLSTNQLWKPTNRMAKFIGVTISFLELVFCFVFLSIMTKCLTRIHFQEEQCILTHCSGWCSSSSERGMWQLLAFSAPRKQRMSPSVIFRSISFSKINSVSVGCITFLVPRSVYV